MKHLIIILSVCLLAGSAFANDGEGYCQRQSALFAKSAQEIEQLYSSGKITEREYAIHLEIQQNAARAVELACIGLSNLKK